MPDQLGGSPSSPSETVTHRRAGAIHGPFYGWYVVAVGTLVAFCSGPGQSYTVGVFVDSIIADTGLSRTTVSTLYAVGTGLSAALVVLVSRMADRHGPRLMLVLVAAGLGLACFGLGLAHNPLTFFLAFAAVRAFGQGSLPINATLLVAQWFVRYRGRAMAIVGLGFAMSNGLLPPLSRALIDGVGWRATYMLLGAMVWVLVIAPGLLIVRDRPEDLGLHPDGANAPPASEIAHLDSRPSADRRRVLSSRAFWMLAIPMAAPGYIVTALVFHQADIFAERGLSAGLAAGVFVPYAIASATMSVTAGMLVERLGPKRLLVANLCLLAAALGLLQLISSSSSAVVYALVLGATGGVQSLVSGVIWAHYYGRHGLGRVQGSAMMVSISGAALGPLPLAGIHALTGGYGAGIVSLAAVAAVCIALAATARPERLADPGKGSG